MKLTPANFVAECDGLTELGWRIRLIKHKRLNFLAQLGWHNRLTYIKVT